MFCQQKMNRRSWRNTKGWRKSRRKPGRRRQRWCPSSRSTRGRDPHPGEVASTDTWRNIRHCCAEECSPRNRHHTEPLHSQDSDREFNLERNNIAIANSIAKTRTHLHAATHRNWTPWAKFVRDLGAAGGPSDAAR